MTPAPVGGRGRFVAFEGGEGSGKSTQARLLADRLGAVLTHEPGATGLGQRIRVLVLDPDSPPASPRAEALLLAADRAQHVDEIVRPALERGEDVVSDRFSGSTLAYQGYGRGLPADDLLRVNRFASRGLEPDLVVLLDVPPDVAAARRHRAPDRMEAEDAAFHARVADGYRALAAASPDRWVVVDGVGDVEEVAERVWKAVSSR